MEFYKSLYIDDLMISQHFDVKQLRVGKTIGILHPFVWNCVKYVNI